jgi:NitT/TauT family transport system substrate-binding protein
MGCIVANKEFVKSNKSATDAFLDEYKASIDYISDPQNIDSAAQYIVDAKVLGALPAAKKSLSNLGDAITYVDGDDMKTILVKFYSAIGVNLIGGRLPDDDFYYKK